jgi:glutamate racemase
MIEALRARGDAPLGVFDSGLGGLTVVRALRQVLPDERIIYLGDTARVPYGTRGPATVVKYALTCARHLTGRGVKAIVVACNTVSAVAPDRLRVEFDIPILGVIEPGARAGVCASQRHKIGVLATHATVNSGAYPRAVAAESTRAEVFGQPAPLLVPLAEEGWTEGEVPRLAARRYLEPLAAAGVDVVVLGCTHYPLLRQVIDGEVRALMGEEVRVVDSAGAVAAETREFLVSRGLARATADGGGLELLVTDVPKTFESVASRFLGGEIPGVQQVDL